MFRIPVDASVNIIDNVPGLAQPVAFSRVADKDGFHTHISQGNLELLRLGNRHIVVVLTMYQHRRSSRLRHIL
jgi:hypothetical protein